MKIAYEVQKNQHTSIRLLLQKVVSIVEDYQRQGYRMTLRQLYYQLVAKDIIPNKNNEYDRLGRILSDARRQGIVDWDFIEDRVREASRPSEWSNISNLIGSAVNSYRLPRWDDQDNYVEVMVEKNALFGILQPICEEYHVYITPNVGYTSDSALHETALRYRVQANRGKGKKIYLVYLGDHDPSGEDMVRDIEARLDLFRADVEVDKLALTMNQIAEYNPPPNPVKLTDTRSDGYREKYGDHSWELDALPPNTLEELLRTRLEELMDMDKYNAVKAKEKKQVKKLQRLVDREFDEEDDEE